VVTVRLAEAGRRWRRQLADTRSNGPFIMKDVDFDLRSHRRGPLKFKIIVLNGRVFHLIRPMITDPPVHAPMHPSQGCSRCVGALVLRPITSGDPAIAKSFLWRRIRIL
jgi:hypothetical protein